MPVLFGIDAASRAEAEAYAIDHNNLVVAGGDASMGDLMRIYDHDRLLDVLRSAALSEQAPVTIDGDDIDALLSLAYAVPEVPEPQEPRVSEVVVEIRCTRAALDEWLGPILDEWSRRDGVEVNIS